MPNAVPPGLDFMAPTVDVTITSASQSILVTSQRTLGSNSGASGLTLYICHRTGGGPLTTSGTGAQGLRVPALTRANFPMTAILTGLAPGTYTVGLCGFSTDVNWLSNGSGSTSVVVF